MAIGRNNEDLRSNWAKEDPFPEVTEEIMKQKKKQEKILRENLGKKKIGKRLKKPLFKKSPTTKSKGKGLRVSAAKGARGLFQLI